MLNTSQSPESSLLVVSDIFTNLSLHLDDVEFLRNAFAVQALIGPLVRISNRGRYEPYVAKSWAQSGDTWVFELHRGLLCEDGQEITPQGFKASLTRSLRRFSMEEIKESPFGKLKGITHLLRDNDDSNLGITATGDKLKFSFESPVGKVLLEYLAMTPFAFLCDANFDGETWSSNQTFLSSGPYKVRKLHSPSHLELELRNGWHLNPPHAFNSVSLSNSSLAVRSPTSKVEMTYSFERSAMTEGVLFEIPRALVSLRLGVEQGRFFADRNNRLALKGAIQAVRNKTQVPFENYHRAETMFFAQATGHEGSPSPMGEVPAPSKVLTIRGRSPGFSADIDFYQAILFKGLDQLGWKYELSTVGFDNADGFFSREYDIAFDRSHVDATVDPEFIRILFKSRLGPKYQDPGSRVSALLVDFDNGKLTYRDFLVGFNTIIAEEAALIPMYHRGLAWCFSGNIDMQAISPMMSILRFEELKMKDSGD